MNINTTSNTNTQSFDTNHKEVNRKDTYKHKIEIVISVDSLKHFKLGWSYSKDDILKHQIEYRTPEKWTVKEILSCFAHNVKTDYGLIKQWVINQNDYILCECKKIWADNKEYVKVAFLSAGIVLATALYQGYNHRNDNKSYVAENIIGLDKTSALDIATLSVKEWSEVESSYDKHISNFKKDSLAASAKAYKININTKLAIENKLNRPLTKEEVKSINRQIKKKKLSIYNSKLKKESLASTKTNEVLTNSDLKKLSLANRNDHKDDLQKLGSSAVNSTLYKIGSDKISSLILNEAEGFYCLPYWDYSQYSVGFGTRYSYEECKALWQRVGLSEQEGKNLAHSLLGMGYKKRLSVLKKYSNLKGSLTFQEAQELRDKEYYTFYNDVYKHYPELPELQKRILAVMVYNTGWGGFSKTPLAKAIKNHGWDSPEVYNLFTKVKVHVKVRDSRGRVVGLKFLKGLYERRKKERDAFFATVDKKSFQNTENLVTTQLNKELNHNLN